MTHVSKKNTLLAGVAVASALVANNASAASVSITSETGIAMETEFGIRSDTSTRGNDLAGAVVTATFDDGASETRTWAAFDPFSTGGVNGDRWSLFQDAIGNVNLVSNGRVMTGFSINASTSSSFTPATSTSPEIVNGASLFDISRADEFAGDDGSTFGSGRGFPFAFAPFGEPDGNIVVTYSGAVNIVGAPAVGDLFTTMSVNLSGLDGGGFDGTVTYMSDQDTLRVAGDLRAITVSAVPLPAGLPLLLAGLGGLTLLRRKQR